MTLQEIENKEQELKRIQAQYKKEIKKMEWQYVKENYNIEKGNVLKCKDKYCVVDEIKGVNKYFETLRCLLIKKDSEIGKNAIEIYSRDATKVFNSYEEYKQALEKL
ncbi:MAG: hypothetical protein LIR50_05835 [Bacillota bacterium]|nr:hypothetical protein [Bacillota bacterium]